MRTLWTKSACTDLHRVREDVRQVSPLAARAVLKAIEATARNLVHYPHMGRIGTEPGLWELVIPGLPYFIVYRVTGDAVQIRRVLHEKQKWPLET